jgi:membrane protease subunit HflC
MNAVKIMMIILTLILLFLVVNALYVVNEREQVVITQFGKPVGDPVYNPGLHIKVPIIQVVNRFEKRFLEWDGDADKLTTKDKRFIWVDVYARWRIEEPKLFLERLRDERSAQSRIDDILDGATREIIAKHKLVEVVRSTNRTPQSDEEMDEDIKTSFQTISTGRSQIEKMIFNAARNPIELLGIELLDFRFKRINYTEEVQREIDDRMISERKRIAEKYRSEGSGEMMRIMGEKERDLKKIISEAYRKAQIIIGEGDAEAVRIYAEAYNQSDESRKFYSFLKTMETYLDTFSSQDTLIMSTEGEYYKYLRDAAGQ